MTGKYFAGGFLFHVGSGKVLLQYRGSRTPHSPNTWCFLGGWSETGDGGRPSTTWRREMHEEIGVTINPRAVVPLCEYLPASSPFHRHVFYCEWPTLAEDFHFPEDEEDLEAVKWLTVEEALDVPKLTLGTRRDLLLFLEHVRPT